jgi:hypothetical protein
VTRPACAARGVIHGATGRVLGMCRHVITGGELCGAPEAMPCEFKRSAGVRPADALREKQAASSVAVPAAGLMQDECRPLHRALASKPDARLHAREAAAAIERERLAGVKVCERPGGCICQPGRVRDDYCSFMPGSVTHKPAAGVGGTLKESGND